jgi:hypothetical protein
MKVTLNYIDNGKIITKEIECLEAGLNTSTDTLMIDYSFNPPIQEHWDRDKILNVKFDRSKS